MRHFVLFLLACIAPTAAFALSDADKVAIAERLSKTYPAIVVSVESRPVISGDKDPTIFRITTSGNPDELNLFLKCHYDIIYTPHANYGLGSYLCNIADEFVKERRKQQADFLPPFSFSAGEKFGGFSFEIKGDQETLKGIVYAFLTLWDFLSKDYGSFDIFVRGYADRGPSFQGQLLDKYPFHDLSYFPLADPNDPLMAIYMRRLEKKKIADTFSNAELPILRATFVKRIIDSFLDECRLTQALTTQAVVLDGAVIDTHAPEYRSIDLYFYAYRRG